MRRLRHAWIALVLALAWWIQPAGSSIRVTSNMPALPLTVPNGGTGVATLAANGVLYGAGTGVALVTAQGPANSVLTANAGAPTFSAAPTVTTLTSSGLTVLAGNSLLLQNAAANSNATIVNSGASGNSIVNVTATDLFLNGAAIRVASGGTGVGTLAANGVLYGNTTGAVLVTTQGAANSVLTANAGAPSFSATPTVTSMTTSGTTVLAGNLLTLQNTAANSSGTVANSGLTGNSVVNVVATALGVNVAAPVADAVLQVAGHIHASSPAATVGTCGTSPAILGSDQGGRVTSGTGNPTACTITFGTAWANIPACTIGPTDTAATISSATISTTAIVASFSAAMNSGIFSYICMGRG